MKKILAFAGSNSSKSINHQLVEYAASLIEGTQVELLDIRKWDVPMYSLDREEETPERIAELIDLIKAYDGFIIASPEHNGGTPAFLKNIFDWISRKEKQVFSNKPVLFMSASPGAGGGANNLKYLSNALSYQGANAVATFSLGAFYKTFVNGEVVADQRDALLDGIEALVSKING